MTETVTPPKFTFATAVTLAALIAQGLMTVELFPAHSVPGKILQVLAMALTAFGAPLLTRAVSSKVLPVALVLLVALAGCAHVQRVSDAYVDCLKPGIASTVSELLPAFRDVVENSISGDGTMDDSALKAAALPLKSAATRCAFTTAMGEVIRGAAKLPGAPMSAPLEVDPVQARAAFEGVRGAWGGEKFKIEGGLL